VRIRGITDEMRDEIKKLGMNKKTPKEIAK